MAKIALAVCIAVFIDLIAMAVVKKAKKKLLVYSIFYYLTSFALIVILVFCEL